jgi:hypothetical protein
MKIIGHRFSTFIFSISQRPKETAVGRGRDIRMN